MDRERSSATLHGHDSSGLVGAAMDFPKPLPVGALGAGEGDGDFAAAITKCLSGVVSG